MCISLSFPMEIPHTYVRHSIWMKFCPSTEHLRYRSQRHAHRFRVQRAAWQWHTLLSLVDIPQSLSTHSLSAEAIKCVRKTLLHIPIRRSGISMLLSEQVPSTSDIPVLCSNTPLTRHIRKRESNLSSSTLQERQLIHSIHSHHVMTCALSVV